MNEPIAVIRQGDQYYLPFVITDNGTAITTENADDVMIQIGTVVKKYSSGEILYQDNHWLFRVEKDDTKRWSGNVNGQIKYKKADDIIHSGVFTVRVDTSILREDF